MQFTCVIVAKHCYSSSNVTFDAVASTASTADLLWLFVKHLAADSNDKSLFQSAVVESLTYHQQLRISSGSRTTTTSTQYVSM